jgi:hypothetical protein
MLIATLDWESGVGHFQQPDVTCVGYNAWRTWGMHPAHDS